MGNTNMSEPNLPTNGRGPKEIAMTWLLGQPAIVVLLAAVVAGGFYVANKVVPLHFDKLKEVVTEQEKSHREERTAEATASREERQTWQRFHAETIDRIERIATGRKTTSIIAPIEKDN